MHAHSTRAMLVREWSLLVRERTVWYAVAILVALAGVAVLDGVNWSRKVTRIHAELRVQEKQRLDSLSQLLDRLGRGDTAGISAFSDPRSAAIVGRGIGARWMLFDVQPLAALAVGQRDLLPHSVRVTTASRRTAPVDEEIENPAVLMAGRIDLSFVLVVLFPLFILSMTYDGVSGERERGTMSLVAAQPVPIRRVLQAKFAVRGFAVVAAALLISIFGALAASWSTNVPVSAGSTALWCLVVILYGAFWFAAAIAVNALGRSSAINAILLLGLWFLSVVVIPALVSNGLSVGYRAPTRISLTNSVRAAQQEISSQQRSRSDALADFLVEHPQYRANADTANAQILAFANAARLDARLRPIFDEFDSRVRSRQDAADRMKVALLDIAGSGHGRWRDFENSWIDFHDRFTQFFMDRILERRPFTNGDVLTIPQPRELMRPLSSLWRTLWPALLAIAVPTFLFAAFASRRLSNIARYTL